MAVGALVLGMGTGVGGSWLLGRRSPPPPAAAPPVLAETEPPGPAAASAEPPARTEAAGTATPTQGVKPAPASNAPESAKASDQAPVAFGWPDGSPVRKKRSLRTDAARVEKAVGVPSSPAEEPVRLADANAVPAKAPEAAPRGNTGSHGALQNVADRGIVASATSTLPRGTIMRVRLSHPLFPERGAKVDAVLTENAYVGGNVVVPLGATVTCHVGSVAEERVHVGCEAAAAGERAWSFSALGLGDGDRAGLRLLDGVVPSGTTFAVAVTASAMLE